MVYASVEILAASLEEVLENCCCFNLGATTKVVFIIGLVLKLKLLMIAFS